MAVPTDLLAAAQEYLQCGLSIFPVVDKKPPKGFSWKEFQNRPPTLKEVKQWFGTGHSYTGIAANMGAVSGNLFCRDFDEPGAYKRWYDENPGLADMLPRARSHRGRHVYGRATSGSLEATRAQLGLRGRGAIDLGDGELRADIGCYTVVPPSQHPAGTTYQWSVPLSSNIPIVNVREFLPKAMLNGKPGLTHRERSSAQRLTGHVLCSPESSGISESSAPSVSQQAIDEAIRRSLPDSIGKRHRSVFEFARHLKAIPHLAAADIQQLKAFVRQWHARALPFIGTKPLEETWLDFAEAWPRVKFASGEEPIAVLFEQVANASPPVISLQYEQSELRLLVSLCRALQQCAGDGPFFLAGRSAAKLLEVPHTQVVRWLRLLCIDRVLEPVSKGKRNKASEYRYLGD